MSETHRWNGGISALVGAWVFASAFVFGMIGAHFWNNLIVGAAVFVLAGYSAYEAGESETGNVWASGLAGVLGLWMIATPFIYGVGTWSMFAYGGATTSMWSGVISGIVIAALSGYNTYEARDLTGDLTAETAGP